MKTVLFINTQSRLGGAEHSLLLLLPHVRRHYGVCVACPSHGELAEELDRIGCPRYSSPAQEGCILSPWRYGRWLASASMSVDSLVRASGADLVHANTVYAGMTVLLTRLRRRRRFIWHARDCLRVAGPARLCGRLCDRVIAVSHAVKEHHVQQGVDPGKIHVVHNGIAPDPSASWRRTLEDRPRGKERFTFANIGQFVPWKRQSVFVAAAARVAAMMPEARFWLVGDKGVGWSAAYGDSLRERVREHRLWRQVEFIPWQKDLTCLWSGIDCLVHTAVGEPFGRVIIEAMARGIPVIAADSGGPAEILSAGNAGILVPPNDVDALSVAMRRVANDPEEAARLGLRGRLEVHSRFLAERTAEQVLQVYADVLRRP